MTLNNEAETTFGPCPVCGASPRVRVTKDGLWAYCILHRKKWRVVGHERRSNRYETQSECELNTDYLSDFDVVDPIVSSAERTAGKEGLDPAQDREGVWRSTRGFLRVVSGGEEYFVLYTLRRYRDPIDLVFGPLDSREAALVAFNDLVEYLLEHGPLSDHTAPLRRNWNKVALVARFLQDHEGFPKEEIARRLLEFQDYVAEVDWMYSQSPQEFDHEDPPTSKGDFPF